MRLPMEKKTRRNYNWLILLIILLVIGIIIWFVIKAVQKEDKSDESVIGQGGNTSVSSELLAKDFVVDYPPTPKEVVKYYAEMTQVLYDGGCTEEEVELLAYNMLLLCDIEFVDHQVTEEYIATLKTEIDAYRENNWNISSYALSSSEDVVYYENEGEEYAQLFCSLSIQKGEDTASINQSYILRKDEEGRYKILGWQTALIDES